MKLEIHVNPHPILSLQHEAVTFIDERRIRFIPQYDPFAAPREIINQVILNFTSSLPDVQTRATYNGMVYTCTINS